MKVCDICGKRIVDGTKILHFDVCTKCAIKIEKFIKFEQAKNKHK